MFLDRKTVKKMRELAHERLQDLKAERMATSKPSEIRSINFAIEDNLKILRNTHGDKIYLFDPESK